MSYVQETGIAFITWLQSFHEQIDFIMGLLSLLVRPELVIVFVLPLLFWNVSARLIAPLFALMMLDVMLGDILKVLFAQPRPWWIADLMPIDPVTSIYSSPGGYTSFATVFFGYLYLHTRKKSWLVIGMVFITVTGLAKMYQAALMPDHMFWGLIQGVLVLVVYARYQRQAWEVFISSSGTRWMILGLGLVALAYLAMLIVFQIHDGYRIPLQYLEYKVVPSHRLSSGGITIAAGFFLGCALGYKANLMANLEPTEQLTVWRKLLVSATGLIMMMLTMVIIRGFLTDIADNRLITWLVNFSLTALSGGVIFYWIPKWFNTWPRGKGLET